MWKTRTSRVCPMRWDRAMACSSFLGLGSGSYMTTVSALCRFRPRPAARMESRKMKVGLFGALKSRMAASLHGSQGLGVLSWPAWKV